MNLKEKIFDALHKVKDPEINTVSILELGMLEEIEISEEAVSIKLLPTFMGCPALEVIERNVAEAVLGTAGTRRVEVKFIHHPPWTSDRITENGRQRLKEFGISPPPNHISETGEWEAECPFCGSIYTTMENLFGPAACRSILYCRSCRNPFEALKPYPR
ncbi:1,2-phenylacetyl-CoA epoxidase subunit PaaD [Peribacillus kribbensis]|uniref:1,2-phenylacetyl-CoA epoxidase subunit PaaD n=1 Tax=Peribacillus kribbensis TaxID=356658 RepID=UPI003CCBB2E0